jgi:RNA polymerase sigma-70 factor (ECF subfamily)
LSDSDISLVARVAANDDRYAFELLLRRHESAIRNFLRRLTQDDFSRADDLAQETFIKAYRSIGSFRGTANFRTWLCRIAYNAFIDDTRRVSSQEDFDDMKHSSRDDFAARAIQEADVERAIRQLSVRQRAVFDLYYRKGMSHSEVALSLEVPIGTVKSDLRRGHASLKEILTKWGFGADETD